MNNKSLAPSVTHRDPKGRKFLSIVETAYDKTGLSEEEAQRVNETPGLGDLIRGFIADHRLPKYADEVVESSYTYPKEYAGPKPIADQIKAVAKIFGLDLEVALEYATDLPELPEGAEGWFAIPSVDALGAKHFPEVTDPAEKYCRAVQLVHTKIAESREFYNWRGNEITPNRLRVHTRTAHALDLIAENQPGDILIIAAQLGMRYRGKSVRRARETFSVQEFGLGSLAVGSIVLVHPERLVRWEELSMDCPGDEFGPSPDGDFCHTLYYFFRDGEIGLDACWTDLPRENYGSVSGFVLR